MLYFSYDVTAQRAIRVWVVLAGLGLGGFTVWVVYGWVVPKDVTEPANIRIHLMRISCAKSVGFGCGFVVRSKLPAILATAIQLSYLKSNNFKRTSSEQLK